MNRTFATALLTAASLVTPAGAWAQNRVQATIPFNFTVDDRLMPAGTYVIAHTGPGMVSISCWKGKDIVTAFALVMRGDEARKKANKLTFDKYGDQYFLSGINNAWGKGAVKVSMSKAEKRIRLQNRLVNQEQTEIAMKQ